MFDCMRIEYVARYTGDWTLRFLLLSLCITPLRKLPHLNGLIKYRRILGLTAFYYGCLHFSHYLYIDKLFDWDDIWVDLTKRRAVDLCRVAASACRIS